MDKVFWAQRLEERKFSKWKNVPQVSSKFFPRATDSLRRNCFCAALHLDHTSKGKIEGEEVYIYIQYKQYKAYSGHSLYI